METEDIILQSHKSKNKTILMCGDCLEKMKNIQAKSVDCVFTDLPYGTTQNKWDKKIPLNDYITINDKYYTESEYFLLMYRTKNISYQDAKKEFQSMKQPGLWTHFNRIIKDNGVVLLWSQQPFSSEIIESNRKMFRYEWIIEKTKGTGFLNAKKNAIKVS